MNTENIVDKPTTDLAKSAYAHHGSAVSALEWLGLKARLAAAGGDDALAAKWRRAKVTLVSWLYGARQ